MVDWRYVDGKDYMPPDAVVKKKRPSEAQRVAAFAREA
jgi:hypothetical protein